MCMQGATESIAGVYASKLDEDRRRYLYPKASGLWTKGVTLRSALLAEFSA